MTTVAPAAPAAATPAPSTSAALSAPAPAAPAVPAGGGTPPATATTETVNPGSWMAGFDDNLKGFVTNKGFKGPQDVANAYLNLEKLQGVPAERIAKMPESFYDEKGILSADGRALWERMGAPKAPGDYQLQIEGAPKERVEFFQNLLHENGVPKTAAQAMISKIAAAESTAAKADIDARAQAFKDQDGSLHKEWGAAYDQNKSIAADGMRRIGLSNAEIDAISSARGHDFTMKLLHKIGKSVGEDTFTKGGRVDGPLDPASARSQINALKGDKAFFAQLEAGDTAALARWTRLHEQEANGATVNI